MPAWARWVRPWTLAAWMCLTLGIALGSWWAYYELGWGGWWFWDPVENASFMPWLAGTALLHSALVMEKREALKSLDDPARHPDLLAVPDRHIPGALGRADLGARLRRRSRARHLHPRDHGAVRSAARWRCSPGAPAMKQGGLFAPICREGGLVLNNLLLTTSCATVLLGTLYPLLLEALTGAKISVGRALLQLHLRAADGAAAAGHAVRSLPGLEALRHHCGRVAPHPRLWSSHSRPSRSHSPSTGAGRGWPRSPSRSAFSSWPALLPKSPSAPRSGRSRSRKLGAACSICPARVFGTTLAHFGLGLMVVGITATSAWRIEDIRIMKPGDTAEIAGYELTLPWRLAGSWPELSRDERPLRGQAQRRADYHAEACQAPLRRATHADDRGRHPSLVARRPLHRPCR